jgi:hypothetical protein
MDLKRLREYLPLVGAAYSKLRKLREAHRKLDWQLNETARQRDELARERNDVARQCQDLAGQCQVLARQNEAYRAHLQICPGGPPLLQAQSESTRLRFIELLRLIRPFDIADRAKIRVGNPHDGGYVMIDDFAGVRAALSIGIGEEISWDMDIGRRGVAVFQFDHTIDAAPVLQRGFRFFRKRVGPSGKVDGETTLAGILELEELRDDRNILMKMDIEGDEWDALDVTSDACIRRIRQCVIEFHQLENFASAEWANRALRVFSKIAQTHQVVHLHGNNHCGFVVLGGIPFPSVIEITLIRRDHHVFTPSQGCWPTALDAPNRPDVADLSIGTFELLEANIAG